MIEFFNNFWGNVISNIVLIIIVLIICIGVMFMAMVKKDLNTDLVNLQDENDELRFELAEERKRNLENYKKLMDETERQKEAAEEKVRMAQQQEKAMMDTLVSFLKDREEVSKLLEELTQRVEMLEEK